MAIDSVHNLAATLITPFFRALDGVLDETASRVHRVVSGLFAALAFPLVLVQMPLRRLACYLAPHPYSVVRGGGPQLPEARTVFQLNVCCPPIDSKTYGGVPPWRERIDVLAEHIRSQRADVVCLQEVYDRKAADALIERLGSEYAHIVYDVGPQSYGCNSTGLMVLSKAPVTNLDFRWYSYGLGAEAWGAKGALAFDIPGIGHVINTHLQYSQKDDAPTVVEQALRRRQLEIVRELVPSDRPTLLLGDLNMVYGEAEERERLASYENLLPRDVGTYVLARGKRRIPITIDYALQFRAGEPRSYRVIPVPSRGVTDHEGLFTVRI